MHILRMDSGVDETEDCLRYLNFILKLIGERIYRYEVGSQVHLKVIASNFGVRLSLQLLQDQLRGV